MTSMHDALTYIKDWVRYTSQHAMLEVRTGAGRVVVSLR